MQRLHSQGFIRYAKVAMRFRLPCPRRLCDGPSGVTVLARLGVAFLGKDAAIPGETRLDSRQRSGSERYLFDRMAH
ncbi:hypothetical protein IC757_01970 [Wenzhouxiangella sp. AB-CW3]|uniref:hypothetical protein n=1 Tax=Wenzhouxiangella sp. AB-CW3 TaxID=2771012 RepID=UPI00168A82A5|nr:hypothetical protein [Wenzhouxiangella sp. AB-CW3]QOC22953.1 hypothetical protein IC757_01970 [Wenzhouxiangella sp. AB-CW3]